MNDIIYLDIESGPLPPEKREFTKPDLETFKQNCDQRWKTETVVAKFDGKLTAWEQGTDAALKAVTGEVLMVGYTYGTEYRNFLNTDEISEAEIIGSIWKQIPEPINIVGHGNLNFDIPFLLRRSLIHGVRFPHWILEDLNQYRPKLIHDTMRYWGFGDRRYYVKLEVLCGAFGIKVKESEVTGADFYKWFAMDREKAIEYNRQDVMCLPELWKRMNP